MGISQPTKAPEIIREQKEIILSQINESLELFKGEKSELIPVLQEVQQRLGYLPEVGLKQIARYIDVPESKVFGVATFYTQFKLVPTGRNIIKVCRGTGCYVRGASKILEALESELGIRAGETTPDLEYTLETVACFGSCALAPVVVVNDRVYGRMTAEKAKKILANKKEET
jgi:NADH-quinone oxidoreductase E subunit